MSEYKLVIPCLMGVEGLVGNELRDMGAQNVEPQNGRVLFDGSGEMIARANLWSRYGERVLIQLAEFRALSFEELFQGVKAIPWERWIGKKEAFPVKGRSLSSKLASVPDCQSIVKKAVVERLKAKYKQSWFEETGSLHQIQFLILKDRVSILLDTSGAGLHKRGYRANSTEAPIKETLAAAMVHLSRVRRDANFIDPFCGSGTILILSLIHISFWKKSFPSIVTVPASGRTMFSMDFKVVLFPAPFFPINPIMRPGLTAKETSCKQKPG